MVSKIERVAQFVHCSPRRSFALKMIVGAITVGVVAILNRLRGGLLTLPPRNLYFAAPLLGAVVWTLRRDRPLSVAIGLGFFIWGFRSWSIWIQSRFHPDLDLQPPDVRLYDALGHHFWATGFFARHWIMLWPLQIALLWLRPGWHAQLMVIGLAAALTASYAIGWSINPHGSGIVTSEWIAGVGWGVFIVMLGDGTALEHKSSSDGPS